MQPHHELFTWPCEALPPHGAVPGFAFGALSNGHECDASAAYFAELAHAPLPPLGAAASAPPSASASIKRCLPA